MYDSKCVRTITAKRNMLIICITSFTGGEIMKKLVKSNKATTNTVRAFHSCSCSCSSCPSKNIGAKVSRAKAGHRDVAEVK